MRPEQRLRGDVDAEIAPGQVQLSGGLPPTVHARGREARPTTFGIAEASEQGNLLVLRLLDRLLNLANRFLRRKRSGGGLVAFGVLRRDTLRGLENPAEPSTLLAEPSEPTFESG
jgi:hypothetical protein